MSGRRLNQIDFSKSDPPICAHCGERLTEPYQRMPEAEKAGTIVLVCQQCGCMTPFREVDPLAAPAMREPGED